MSRMVGMEEMGYRAGGLRERKKLRTRRLLQAEAIRLFEAKGFDATTIEEIAAAAEVSPRTFSRYFSGKEDVVLWDDFEPTFFDRLEARPLDEPLAQAFREALREGLSSVGAEERGRMQRRMRLIYATPALRERGYPQLAGLMTQAASIIAGRLRLPPDDPRARLLGGALMGGLVALFEVWQERGGRIEDDALDVLLQALDLDRLIVPNQGPA
jgi:AcrR family transcriptional regulator